MKPLERIFAEARRRARHLILPEGQDPRVAAAARAIVERGLARVTLMGGPGIPGVGHIDAAHAPDLDDLAAQWQRMRAHLGMSFEQARAEMRDPVRQAAMRVRLGEACGTLAGAATTTAETVRAALRIIGPAPGVRLVSSFFLMLACGPGTALRGGMIFADCGLVIAPDAEELAQIALSAARSCRQLLGEEPRVAFLSFSTAGSADHPCLARIREAVAIVRAREPGLEVDGELQFDAAIDDAIRARKAPGSRLRGRPNVFIFPDLAAGNIGYKIAERLGGLRAVGPILQGLSRPANDLSRGCSVDDIIAAAAITALQADAPPAPAPGPVAAPPAMPRAAAGA